MSDHLPEIIDPVVLAEKRRRLVGKLAIANLPRIADVLLTHEGDVALDLTFGKDGRFAVVTGKVETDVNLQCQSCLGPLPWHIASEVRLAVATSIDAASLLPESYEPLLLEEESIALADIVQDEILLAIPSIPRHDACNRMVDTGDERLPRRDNPFAALAELKKS